MNIYELEDLINGIHDKSIEIVIETEPGVFKPLCIVNSKMIEAEKITLNELGEMQELHEDEEPETETLLLLAPCTCDDDECDLPEIGEINSQPELN